MESMSRSQPVCVPVPRAAPAKIKDWKGAGPTDHFVQFYRTDDYLIECLAGYAAEGVWKRDVVVVIATPEHRFALEERLRVKGVDVIGATVGRHLLMLDAEAMLSKFVVGGRPNRDLFNKVIGDLVREATANGRRLRAYGEMVALLWADGNRTGAIELEQLWNDLARQQAFSLFCAYPAACAETKGDGPSLEHVCAAHSCVISLAA
jgi:hypothetical protein